MPPWLERWIDRIACSRVNIARVTPDGHDPYLTRWRLIGRHHGEGSPFAVYLHRFLRSDSDTMHDHPWPFTSLILAGGYYEKTPAPGWSNGVGPTRLRWYGPGRILVRPANWVHAVILPPGGTAYTLVFRGAKTRSWGFHCPGGWKPWREHHRSLALTGDGCG